ncbi:hypothetical protein A2703_03440 [Candidatus Collierbacteria bacterium RIFCSPHIGHO2_01_FULL_50_25]|uniref:Glutamine amidotransferase domain-containing protein n=1 Tax=Candidatus Collierbacteria bacterium RIFCSPHIGHO2_01_FULL_50_25 TaxID=1817722 RepID=A0A1F5EVU5_9BACT|nr:MAG: hypothetical protein A2703_03440 [Candidatus Collierbacteria bacterium RIFCSPHIGHO2_01_FULL_50_25]
MGYLKYATRFSSKTSLVHHNGHHLFEGLENPFNACRYRSLAVTTQEAEKHGLDVIAWTQEDEVMAVVHRVYKNVLGVQFHPESIFTEGGLTVLQNFLKM